MNKTEQQTRQQGVEQTDLATLIKHREWVSAETPLGEVYHWFEKHDHDSCAVMEGGKLLGLCSRARLAFMLGHRFGYPIYSRQPVRLHLNQNAMFIKRGEPLREVLERVLCRQGKTFNEDVALLGDGGEYLGVITVPSLVHLQSALVSEKFRTQETLHGELLSVSRQAGMAEVATSVLHNVGNVLNSVKVAASVISEKVRRSKSGSVVKVSKLLKENADHLAEFMSQDERGRKLPHFMEQLGMHMEKDQEELRKELEGLTQFIEHIERIIFTQQSYAKVTAVLEKIDVADLIEDALKINCEAYSRHGIKLRREFDSVPEALVDKHKVLQILVNLLSNAKHACQAMVNPNREVVIRLNPVGPNRIRIEVADNGMGIAPENLSRIFTHGFTTRKTGHGFGLHNGALAAREMGGSLTVHSDGPGRGATFTLEIPLTPVVAKDKPQPPVRAGSSHQPKPLTPTRRAAEELAAVAA